MTGALTDVHSARGTPLSQERLLVDGRERALRDPELRAELERAVAEIEARYAPLLERAGLLRRLVLRWRMRREVQRELELRAPRDALYVRA